MTEAVVQSEEDLILAKTVIERKNLLSRERGTWESIWREVSNFVYPDSDDFSGSTSSGSSYKYKLIYDSTAPRAVADLATTFHSQFTNISQRWFQLRPPRKFVKTDNSDSKRLRQWYDNLCNIMFEDVFSNPDTNFGTAMHEFYGSLIAYGTAILYVEDRKPDPILFKSMFLGECLIAEGAGGQVDTLYRSFMMTSKNILQKFDSGLSTELREMLLEKPFESWEVVHAVEPNAVLNDDTSSKNKPFRSVYVFVKDNIILSHSGYDNFPYIVARWDRRPNEVYGRSPTFKMMPDIKMLNAMMKITIEAAQMSVFPPMQRVSDGLTSDANFSMAPKRFYAVRHDRNRYTPLIEGVNPNIAEPLIAAYRQSIREGFYGDVTSESKKNYLTAHEVLDTRDKSQSKLGSVMNRIETEALKPVVSLVMAMLLKRDGYIEDAPVPNLPKDSLNIVYVSPISRSMRIADLTYVRHWFELMTGGQPITAEVAALINQEELGRWAHETLGLPENILVSHEQYAKSMKEFNDRQQQMAEAETAKIRAGAIKDGADAEATLGGGNGG